MRVPLLLTLAVLAVVLWASKADGAPRDPRLAGVEDFAFALGADVDSDGEVARLAPYDLVVVDGELTGRGRVEQLRSAGSIVLGYLSVGTIEPYRSWYRMLKPFRLPDRFEEFDEDYARVSARGFRRAILGRIAPKVLRRGFDGLFLDNTDMVEGHPKQRNGMGKLVRRLARLVHARGGLLFAQNGERSVGPLLDVLDGWNREDVTWTYSFKRRRYVHRPLDEVAAAQAALTRIGAAGLLVTSADYTAGDPASEQESVANACAAGAVPFVSNIALTRLPAAPLRCSP
jgi:polysaccharide biosynthesis protein PelA